MCKGWCIFLDKILVCVQLVYNPLHHGYLCLNAYEYILTAMTIPFHGRMGRLGTNISNMLTV